MLDSTGLLSFNALLRMNIDLAYGEGKLPLELPEDRTTVIEPRFSEGIADEKASVLNALDHPIGRRLTRRESASRRQGLHPFHGPYPSHAKRTHHSMVARISGGPSKGEHYTAEPIGNASTEYQR